MKKVRLHFATGRDPVFRQYSGQNSPQPAFLELDCKTGVVRATHNCEIGNAIPFSVYHGHDRRFAIPCYASCRWINAIMRQCRPHFQAILDGYTAEWDGHNTVAQFTDEARGEMECVADYIAREGGMVSCPPRLDVW